MAGGFQRARDEGMQQGIERGIEQGIERGRVEGERAVVERQLLRRFGALPRSASERLVRASMADLERWADRVLEANSLEDVFSPRR